MSKALLSLWLLGAATYTANTVILSRLPAGSGGAIAECAVPKQSSLNVTDVPKTVRPTKTDEAGPAKLEQTGTANDSPSAPAADRIAAVESPAVLATNDNAHYDWAEIQRSGAYAHSEPSVNAAVISIFPVGKQLRILAYRNGWVQLQDTAGPAGWVYEQYVASIALPNEKRQAASEPEPPPLVAPVQSRGSSFLPPPGSQPALRERSAMPCPRTSCSRPVCDSPALQECIRARCCSPIFFRGARSGCISRETRTIYPSKLRRALLLGTRPAPWASRVNAAA